MTAQNTIGRATVVPLTNQSGGSVAAGDLVYIDTAHDEAFITGTTSAYTGMVGVVQDTSIASGAVGLVRVGGYASLVNVNASVTRGHYAKSYTVAKQATDAGASRVVGAFGQFLTGGTTPSIELFGFPDAAAASASASTPGLTLSTSNSAGSAATFVATDATVAVFDATAPVTQAFSDAAAAGSAGVAARRDHKHGMPADPSVAPWVIRADSPLNHSGFASVGASNRAIWQTCVIPAACTVGGIQVNIGTSSGNICVGLYDSTFTRVATSGSVASPGTGQRKIAFTAGYVASAGRYYLGIAADNNTVTFSVSDSAALNSPFENPQYKETSFVLPAGPVTPAGATSISVNLIGYVTSPAGYP